MSIIKDTFTPPYYDNIQEYRQGKYAHFIALIMITGWLCMIWLDSFFHTDELILFYYIFCSATILFFILNKAKLIHHQMSFIILLSMAAVFMIMYMSEGTHDEVILLIPTTLFIASLAFDRKILVFTAIADIGAIWAIGLLEIYGRITNLFSFSTNYLQLIVMSLLTILSVVAIDLLVNDFKFINNALNNKSHELEDANKKLEEENISKDKYFSLLAHDLRIPFQGLLGTANLLAKPGNDLTEEEKKILVTNLNNALQRQYDFLEEFLIWGRFHGGLERVKSDVFNVVEVINKNLNLLKYNIEGKNIIMKLTAPKVLEARIDENIIGIVFRNILSNAIKFTPAGGKINVYLLDESEKFVIRVDDTGIGIDKDKLKAIAGNKRFTSTPGTEEEHGAGLGLMLSKEIIENMGGKLSVLSETGKGSSFSIRFDKGLMS